MARKRDIQVERQVFTIVTNGKETECNYFSQLKQRSIYKIQLIFENADPYGLVERAKREKENSNQVWIVFDIDRFHEEGKLVPALNLAKKENINVAFSNLAFEVWLISHFEKCSKHMTTAEHITKLNRLLKDNNYGAEYSKSDEKLLKKLFIPKYADAVTNSKAVYQTRLRDFREEYGPDSNPPVWEWNSCTTVFKLIEALRLKK